MTEDWISFNRMFLKTLLIILFALFVKHNHPYKILEMNSRLIKTVFKKHSFLQSWIGKCSSKLSITYRHALRLIVIFGANLYLLFVFSAMIIYKKIKNSNRFHIYLLISCKYGISNRGNCLLFQINL